MNTTNTTKSPLAIKRFRNKLLKNVEEAYRARSRVYDLESDEYVKAHACLIEARQALAAETEECPGEAHGNGWKR